MTREETLVLTKKESDIEPELVEYKKIRLSPRDE